MNDASRVAVYAIHIAIGFFETGLLNEGEASKYGGHIGASEACADIALTLAAVMERIDQELDPPYGGVFEYEAAEEIGKLARRLGGYVRPTLDEEIVKIIIKFFEKTLNLNSNPKLVEVRKIADPARHQLLTAQTGRLVCL